MGASYGIKATSGSVFLFVEKRLNAFAKWPYRHRNFVDLLFRLWRKLFIYYRRIEWHAHFTKRLSVADIGHVFVCHGDSLLFDLAKYRAQTSQRFAKLVSSQIAQVASYATVGFALSVGIAQPD
jgi:hypothetical protein